MAAFSVSRAVVMPGSFSGMLKLLSSDVLAAAEEAFRIEALDFGRERAEVAADLRGDLHDPTDRAAWIEAFAQAFAESYREGTQAERARIHGLLSVPNVTVLLPTSYGSVVTVRADDDGEVHAQTFHPGKPVAGRAL